MEISGRRVGGYKPIEVTILIKSEGDYNKFIANMDEVIKMSRGYPCGEYIYDFACALKREAAHGALQE